MLAHRALVFPVMFEDPRLGWLLAEFRLLVNESIRIALRDDIRSRARLTRVAYKDLGARHAVYKQYIPSAFEVALSVLKVHRRRVRKGKRTSIPFIRRLLLKAENQSYWLDRETGRLRIPIRGTEGVQLHLPLSEWHRSILGDSSWGLGSLIVVPGKIIVVLRKEARSPMSLGARSPWTRTRIPSTGSMDRAIRRGSSVCRSTVCGVSRRLTSDDGGGSRGRRPTTDASSGSSSIEKVAGKGTESDRGSIEYPNRSCGPQRGVEPQSSSKTSRSTGRADVPVG